MPYISKAPNWRTRQHPLNQLLSNLGSSGGTPTRAELDALPDDAGVRHAVKQTAQRIQHLKEQGEHLAARREAERALGELGPRVEGKPLPEPEPAPEPASLDDLAARMFGN